MNNDSNTLGCLKLVAAVSLSIEILMLEDSAFPIFSVTSVGCKKW